MKRILSYEIQENDDGTTLSFFLKKQRFSISVPRASYISEALVEFSKDLGKESVEIFYKETNSQRTIHNILKHDYKLGIIRYAENYDKYFKTMLEEKGLCYELVTEFSYSLIMSADSPLAQKEDITFDDLTEYIEIAHADPYVPSMPLSKVVKEEPTIDLNVSCIAKLIASLLSLYVFFLSKYL